MPSSDNILPITYTDIEYEGSPRGLFTIYPLPDETTAGSHAINSLRSNLSVILRKDKRLGSGNKRLEYTASEDLIMHDDVAEGMIARRFGGTLRITFFERAEAAKFRFLYCADDRFENIWRDFV